MLILNEPFSSEKFVEVKTIEDIKNTPNNATLLFTYCDSSLELYNFCKLNNIPYAVKIEDEKELIFISNLKAKYAFVDNLEKAYQFQKIVDDYLLDIRVVFLINSLNEIKKVLKYKIDAVKLKETR